MKNLFYKELKLSMHPVIYVFLGLFPLFVLIPTYPLCVSFIYIAAVYPILFLGANKGQQSNDLLYTALLPVRKRDIVKARLLTMTAIQVVAIVLLLIFNPLGKYIFETIKASAGTGKGPVIPGFSHDAAISMCGFAFACMSIYDFIFLIRYYKKGKSILMPTLLGLAILSILLCGLTIILPMLFPAYASLFTDNIGLQFVFLFAGIAIGVCIKYLGYIIARNRFDKADL